MIQKLKIFLVLLLVVPLFSCFNENELKTPSQFNINQGILTFNEVKNASRYKLILSDEENKEYIHYIERSNVELDNFINDNQVYKVKLQAINNEKESKFTQVIEYQKNQINFINKNNLESSLIKWYGRVDYVNEMMSFNNTASGFEIKFFGTMLKATIYATQSDFSILRPYISVFIDEENNPFNAKVIPLDEESKEYILASDLELRLHTIKVYKRTESMISQNFLVNLTTDHRFINQQDSQKLKIEFIGDSLTTGYGILGLSTYESYRTQTQDGLLTYAGLTARMLNADFSIFAYSGIGVHLGYYQKIMPDLYNQVDSYIVKSWDFTKFVPNVVVINLGANDNGVLSNYTQQYRDDVLVLFEEAYRNFIFKVKENYPSAIIVALTIEEGQNYVKSKIIEVVNKIRTSDENVYHVALGGVLKEEGMGSSNHPNYKTHIRQAEILTKALEEILDIKRVFPNVIAK